jgi:23S rRNA (guanosine2251-2'-O)-methyltransferase
MAMANRRALSGFHAVTARLRSTNSAVHAIYVLASRDDARMRELVAQASRLAVSVHRVDSQRLDSLAGHDRHQGVVALVDSAPAITTLAEVFDVDHGPALLLVLDGVTDPHNLGACLRSADAFGAHAVIVPKDRSAGISDVVARASAGALDALPLIMVTNLARALRELKEREVWLHGADAGGSVTLPGADLTGPLAWVLGAEGGGLRRLTRELCDFLVAIPLAGTVSSLNVSVAAAICLYETRRQRDTPA